MKILSLTLLMFFLATSLFADSSTMKNFKNMAEIRAMNRHVKTQEKLDKTKNKSAHSLKNKKLTQRIYFRRNFSFCDFKNTDIRGVTFDGCNFSFSINLDKAITDRETFFIGCNLTCADLPITARMEKCNKRRFSDEEIEEHFKDKKKDIQ